MRSIGIASALVAVATSSARAEGPIVINASLGINVPLAGPDLTCFPDHEWKHGSVLNLDIAYRFIDELAAGVHFGTRRYPWDSCGGNLPGSYNVYGGVDTAIELGVAAQFSVRRFWFAPWFGIEDTAGGFGGRDIAYALVTGVDVYVHPSGHRVGVYLDLTTVNVTRPYPTTDEQHLSAGVAYRYW